MTDCGVVMSRFVAFCRDVASFCGAHKCDMPATEQDPNGVNTSISKGFDHRWTQMKMERRLRLV